MQPEKRGCQGVPHRAASTARLPPRSTPSTRPPRAPSTASGAQVTGPGSSPKTSARRRSRAAGSSPSWVHIGPWMDGTPACAHSSWSTVASL